MVSDLAAAVGAAIIGGGAGVVGITLGARLNRQNEKQAQADRLLVDALNEAVDAVAIISHHADGSLAEKAGLLKYAGAMSRVALYGSPEVVAAFRRFQEVANTGTTEGRDRYVAAAAAARADLDRGAAEPGDLRTLFFGSLEP